jgi:hypothetical protein
MNSTTGLSSDLSLVYFYRMYSVQVILPIGLIVLRLETVETDIGPLSLYSISYTYFSIPLSMVSVNLSRRRFPVSLWSPLSS